MTRARVLTLLAAGLLLASLLVPASAGAQLSQSIQIFGAPAFSIRELPVRFSGQLTVAFHGDAASGCASRGLCGYAGTVSWRPPPSGGLEIYTYRHHGRLTYAVDLAPVGASNSPSSSPGVATADVALSNSPPLAPSLVSSCLDATDTAAFLSLPVHHGRVTFTLAGASPSLLGTRCAGPLDGDVIPHIPAPTLPLAVVLRGRAAVALSASGGFASHGFAGTVHSSLTMALGRPGRTMRTHSANRVPGLRQIQVLYRATLSGSVVERVRGAAAPAICAPLGSCGLGGTVTLAPRATGGQASIGVLASSRTPYRDLLAAVGLSTPGRAKRVVLAAGAVTLNRGISAADLALGSTTCRDSAPLGLGDITLTTAKGRLEAQYQPAFGALTARTRCPGPGDSGAQTLATGAVPVVRLAHRTVRVSLTAGSTFSDYGYDVRTVPHLTLTLTRVRVHIPGGFSTFLAGAVGASNGGGFLGF